MHVYKGAEFWGDAALKYLERNVLNVNGEAKYSSFFSKWWNTPKYGFGILAFGGVFLSSILALFYMKKQAISG